MDKYEMKFDDYLVVILRHKWTILIVFFSVFILTWIFSVKKVPLYRAQSRIILNTDIKSPLDLIKPKVQTNIKRAISELDSYEFLKETLLALGNIDKYSDGSEVNLEIERIKQKATYNQVPNSDVIEITVVDTYPEGTAIVANKIAEVFQKREEKRARDMVESKVKFFERQVDEYALQHENANAALNRYKESENIVSIKSEIDVRLTNIETIKRNMTDAELQMAETKKKLDLTQERQSRYLESAVKTKVEADPMVFSLQQRTEELRTTRDKLLSTYTAKHPEVLEKEEEVSKAEKKLADYVQRVRNSEMMQIGNQQKTEIDAIKSQIEISETRKKKYNEQVASFGMQLNSLRDKETRYNALVDERDKLAKILDSYKQKLEDIHIYKASESLTSTYAEQAVQPGKPFSPRLGLNLLFGTLSGLLLGLISAFVFEGFSTNISSIEQMKELLDEDIIAIIPLFDKRGSHSEIHDDKIAGLEEKVRALEDTGAGKDRKTSKEKEFSRKLISLHNPKDPAVECFRNLRTNILNEFKKGNKKTVLFTSAFPQEGKSVVSCNTAVVFAQAGLKTVLVNTNMRRPTAEKYFRIKDETGLADCLQGKKNVADVIVSPGIDNLWIVPSGGVPDNPSELLQNGRIDGIIDELKNEFDAVILDSPPLLPVTDTTILLSKVDCVVMVHFLGRVARNMLVHSRGLIKTSGGNIIGVVINGVKPGGLLNQGAYSHYYYNHNYS